MLFLTCFDAKMAECGVYCTRSVERYLTKHPKYHFAVEIIPAGYERPASWYKVPAILKHLPDHDFVLCLDADAMIVGSDDIGAMIKDATLNIARDHNGVNHGVSAWKNCPEAFWALECMNRGYEGKEDHPWYEQAILMEIEREINIHYQNKVRFNAYPQDRNETTQILHLPGMLNHDRVPIMAAEYQKLTTL